MNTKREIWIDTVHLFENLIFSNRYYSNYFYYNIDSLLSTILKNVYSPEDDLNLEEKYS